MVSAVLVACTLLLIPFASAESVNAVEKVVELLRNLRSEVEAEGKADAATYDKFACFCKEQATDKQWAIEQSEERITRLTNEIDALDDKILVLDGEISTLDDTRNNSRSDMNMLKNSQKALDNAHKRTTKQRETDIALVEKAMERMEKTKDDVSSAALVQLAKAHGEHEIAKTLGDGAGFGEDATGAGSGAQYKYSSDTVNAALRKFLYILKDAQERAEAAWREKSESLEIRWREKKKTMEQADEALERKDEEKGRLELEKSGKEDERTREQTAKQQDHDFITELSTECNTKAKSWDEDSEDRAGEIQALSEAIQALTEENPDQNTREQGNKVGDRYAATNMAASFLQSRKRSTEEVAMATLGSAVSKLKSENLGGLRLKIQMMGKSATNDHFKKVREIISKLIGDLKTALAAADTDADSCAGAQASVSAAKRGASDTMATNKMDMLAAQRDIKENEAEKKALQAEHTQIVQEENERTELRAEEQKAWDEARPKLKEGIDAVQAAIDALTAFYGFLQVKADPFRAANADRDGNTVRDLAPKREGYGAKTDQSKSILALLRTIKSDFQKSFDDRKAENDVQAAKFQYEQGRNDKRKGNNEGEHEQAEQDILTAQGNVETYQTNLEEAEGDYDTATETLDAAPCPKQETWDERSAARKSEIEQLKAALVILEKRDGVVNVAER